MIEIVSIRKTKRGRHALFSQQGFMFSIDSETMVVHNICEGSSISQEELLLLKEQSDTRKAADAALRYLSLRAYGQNELYNKLLLRYDEHSAAAAVAKMVDAGLLDDNNFAIEKAKGMAQRGKTPLEIRQKLLSLGLDKQLVAQAVQEIDIDTAQMALELVQKRYMDALEKGQHQKVMAALARRGYSHKDIKAALNAAEEEI